MFDIGWTEMMVIAVVAIVVVGPRDLPKLLRVVGQFVRQARKLAREFQSGVDDLIRESDIDEVRKSVHHVSNFDPASRSEPVIDPAKPKTGATPKGPEESKPDDGKSATNKVEDGKGNGA
ncbi:MAG: Sec-independent protein translocase protein TatB [Sphingomonadales bacterium]